MVRNHGMDNNDTNSGKTTPGANSGNSENTTSTLAKGKPRIITASGTMGRFGTAGYSASLGRTLTKK